MWVHKTGPYSYALIHPGILFFVVMAVASTSARLRVQVFLLKTYLLYVKTVGNWGFWVGRIKGAEMP